MYIAALVSGDVHHVVCSQKDFPGITTMRFAGINWAVYFQMPHPLHKNSQPVGQNTEHSFTANLPKFLVVVCFEVDPPFNYNVIFWSYSWSLAKWQSRDIWTSGFYIVVCINYRGIFYSRSETMVYFFHCAVLLQIKYYHKAQEMKTWHQ